MTVAAPAAPVAAKAPIDFKKFIKPGIAVVAVIAVVIVLFSVLGGGAAATGFLYVQDGEGFFLEKAGAEGWQHTDDLTDSNIGESILAGGHLFYLDRGDSLYYRPADDPEGEAVKLSSDVESFAPSKDGDQVLFVSDDNLYFHDLDEKTKIASDVDDRFYPSLEADEAIYESDGSCYYWDGNDAVKLFSEGSLKHITNDFSAVYYKKDDAFYLRDLGDEDGIKLVDDCTGTSPIYEDGTFYFGQYVDPDDPSEGTNLCYYDGSTTVTLLNSIKDGQFCDEAAAAFIADKDDTYYVAVEGTLTTLAFSEKINDLTFAEDGSAIYLTANVCDNHGDLYKIAISGSTAEEPTLYDTDVYYSITCSGTDVMYYKNHTDKSSDLYRNGEMIATDVYSKTVTEDGTVYLRTDYDNGSYTLSVYDGSIEKIADDVHSFVVADNGEVAFLADWSSSRDKGTLYTWDGGDPEKIADDVSRVDAVQCVTDELNSNFEN